MLRTKSSKDSSRIGTSEVEQMYDQTCGNYYENETDWRFVKIKKYKSYASVEL